MCSAPKASWHSFHNRENGGQCLVPRRCEGGSAATARGLGLGWTSRAPPLGAGLHSDRPPTQGSVRTNEKGLVMLRKATGCCYDVS